MLRLRAQTGNHIWCNQPDALVPFVSLGSRLYEEEDTMAQRQIGSELGGGGGARSGGGPGESIKLMRKLGQGQFGTVHLAETQSGEQRAVKRIQVSRMRSEKDVQNLDREIKLLQVC